MKQPFMVVLVVASIGQGVGLTRPAYAWNDAAYFADKATWIMFAETEVAAKLHRKDDALKFADETMYLTRNPEEARDPVVICGNVSLLPDKPGQLPKRFISNGDPKRTYIDDRTGQFDDRWLRWCKAVALAAAKPGMVYEARQAVLSMLKDPDSAEFGDIEEKIISKTGIHIACGRVNAKNGFGGYGGLKRFISAGTPATTSIEGTMPGFDKKWALLC